MIIGDQSYKMKLPHQTEQVAVLDNQPDSSKILRIIESCFSNQKAQNIISIDLSGKTDVADYMVIASGTSERHVVSLADHLLKNLSEHDVLPYSVEGTENKVWVLVDLGDIIIHIFTPETREFYNLEKMWDVAIPSQQIETID